MQQPIPREPHLSAFDAMLGVANEITDRARTGSVSIAEADRMAKAKGVDLSMVLGHLALMRECSVDYVKGVIQCWR